MTAAAALLYDNAADAEWKRLKESMGVEGVLRDICRLEKGSELEGGILKFYAKMNEVRADNKPIVHELVKREGVYSVFIQ